MKKGQILAMSIFCNLKYLDDNNKIVELHSIDNGIGMVNYGWGDAKEFSNVTPILHPLSDLTKEITHKGETFIPIVELLKMEQSLGLKYARINHNVTKIDTHESSEGNTYQVEYTEPYSNMEDGLIQFSYSERYRRFGKVMFKPYRQALGVGFQFDMFQKLIEWHFNLMDESELFIDVNTIENPY